MALSLIIPTYNRTDDLKRLFESVVSQTVLPAEIVVIVGPGDTKSKALVQTYSGRIGGIRIFQASKPSLVHSLNLGIAAATQEIIALVDDDVWLPETWVSKILTAFDKNPKMGAYGGRDILQIDEDRFRLAKPSEKVGVFTWSGGLEGNHHNGSMISPVIVDVLKGCNLSFRKKALHPLEIEPALEGRGAEVSTEIDICQRIQARGLDIVYDNDNYVLHYAAQRSDDDDRVDLFSPLSAARIYNQGITLSKFRSLREVILTTTKSFLIGSRIEPGVLISIFLFPKYKWKVFKLAKQNSVARIKGIMKGFELRKKLRRNTTDKRVIK